MSDHNGSNWADLGGLDGVGVAARDGTGSDGLAIGLAAIPLVRLLRTMLFGIRESDALTFAATSLLLVAVALLANYMAARGRLGLSRYFRLGQIRLRMLRHRARPVPTFAAQLVHRHLGWVVQIMEGFIDAATS
jgi:hypothetical protein